MSQRLLSRIHFEPRVTILSPANDDRQLVDFTGYFEIGDVVDVIDVDPNGNIVSTLADNLTILAVEPGVSVTLSAVVNAAAATGTPKIRVQEIDDADAAMDRLYRRKLQAEIDYGRKEAVVASVLNSPSAGKTTFEVADSHFFAVGDLVDVLADEGLVASNAQIDSVSVLADAANNKSEIVVNAAVDLTGFTNVKLLNKTLTVKKAIERNQARIDQMDQPVENEFLGIGNGADTVFLVASLFKQGTTKLLMDGTRKRLGTAGTRASLTQGAGNAQLIFTSNLLGLLGNEIRVQVQSGAGLTIAVTKAFAASSSAINTAQTDYLITINDNGGTATAAQIAAALNAHADVKRILMVQYGGTGADVVTPFGPTALAGGLDDGTGDYAELEQVFENVIVNTGYKMVSLHIRPNEANRLDSPPQDSEELVVDYRTAADNVDR